MVERDLIENVSIGLRKTQITGVEHFLNKQKRFKSVSSFYQHLTDEYFAREQNWKSKVAQLMLFLGWPLILATFMLYVARSTEAVNQLIVTQEGVLIVELAELSNHFFILGFACLGLLLASMMALYFKLNKKR